MTDKVISKLSDKCKRCNHVNECNEKRMMLCRAADKPSIALNIQPVVAPLLQPVLRDTSIQAEMHEQLKKNFHESFYGCAFTK